VKHWLSPFSRQSGLSSSQGIGTVGRKSMNRRANWNGGEKSARVIETTGSKRSLLAEDLKPSDFPPPKIPDFRRQLNPSTYGTREFGVQGRRQLLHKSAGWSPEIQANLQRPNLLLSRKLSADVDSDPLILVPDLFGFHRDQAIAVLLITLTSRVRRKCGDNAQRQERNAYHRRHPFLSTG
jgi:hypothetical protein